MKIELEGLKESHLVRYFWEFYAEVVKLKRLIREDVARRADLGPAAGVGRAPDAEVMVHRLQTILERQSEAMARRGVDFAIVEYREAQYVMAALADDIFLHEVDWPGRDTWADHILEERLFKSRIAGERIFDNIGRILQSRDSRRAELAAVYLLALHLGFKGRFRDGEDQAPLAEYLGRLFNFVTGRNADLKAPERRLVPSAYAHTLSDPSNKRLRLKLDWRLALVAVVAVQLAVAQGLWWLATSDFGEAADQVFQAAMGR